MTDEELKKDLMTDLQYYTHNLTKEQLDYCTRYSTYTALKHWEDKLSDDQKQYCEEKTA